jgi:hypothetical protein
MEPHIPIRRPILKEGTSILSELGCESPTTAESALAGSRKSSYRQEILIFLQGSDVSVYRLGEEREVNDIPVRKELKGCALPHDVIPSACNESAATIMVLGIFYQHREISRGGFTN